MACVSADTDTDDAKFVIFVASAVVGAFQAGASVFLFLGIQRKGQLVVKVVVKV